MRAFEPEELVAACTEARAEPNPVVAIRDVVQRVVRDPTALARYVEIPLDPDDDRVLHQSPELFISLSMMPAGFRTGIHDHGVEAVIGTWSGFEDNVFYRRTGTGVERSARQRVKVGEVVVLSADAVHDVHAPSTSWSGAVHVYLGDIDALDANYWADPAAAVTRLDYAEMGQRWRQTARATGLLAPADEGPD